VIRSIAVAPYFLTHCAINFHISSKTIGNDVGQQENNADSLICNIYHQADINHSLFAHTWPQKCFERDVFLLDAIYFPTRLSAMSVLKHIAGIVALIFTASAVVLVSAPVYAAARPAEDQVVAEKQALPEEAIVETKIVPEPGVPPVMDKAAAKQAKADAKKAKAAAKKAAKEAAENKEPDPNRIEWLPFPVIGGNTDMGILVGAQIFLAKFKPGYTPYRFRTHTQLSLSFKSGENGVQIPVHMDFVKFDFPGLAGGKLRFIFGLYYDQINNAGYFGIGNASRAVRDYWDAEKGEMVERASNMYQYQRMEPKLRLLFKYKLVKNLELAIGLRFMWMKVTAFQNSWLEKELSTLNGVDPHFGLQFSAGLIYDTRDHEYNPSKGMLIETSLRGSPGLGNDLNFGGYNLDARFFVPILGEQLVFASRWVVDMLFGTVPFYEMSRAGGFDAMDFLGGRLGLSGIPEGRYHGQVKIGANIEFRSMVFPLAVGKHRFKFGMATFCNVGRVWSDYSSDILKDGTGIGLKVAAGGGIRVQYGETVMMRVDIAWAKEAADAGSPVGLYFDAYHPF
jgi:hypothetical protein